MRSKEPGDDKFACFVCNLNRSCLTGTKIILWLTAITIVAFVIGFGILAASGNLPLSSENKASPFRHTSMLTPNTTTISLDGGTAGNVRITMGAGEVTLRGGSPSAALVEATVFSKAPEWQPDITQSINGSVKSVIITDKGHHGKTWFAVDSPNSWEILVNDQIPVDLTADVGAGDNHLDLGTLNLASLVVNNGVGDTEIDFGRNRLGPYHAEIHNGVGDLTIRIPKNSNTRISLNHGVGDISSKGFEQENDILVTAGFNPALPTNEIFVKQGVGDISLETV
jgi:hypothetical protein